MELLLGENFDRYDLPYPRQYSVVTDFPYRASRERNTDPFVKDAIGEETCRSNAARMSVVGLAASPKQKILPEDGLGISPSRRSALHNYRSYRMLSQLDSQGSQQQLKPQSAIHVRDRSCTAGRQHLISRSCTISHCTCIPASVMISEARLKQHSSNSDKGVFSPQDGP